MASSRPDASSLPQPIPLALSVGHGRMKTNTAQSLLRNVLPTREPGKRGEGRPPSVPPSFFRMGRS